MVEINSIEPNVLIDAVVVWTGYDTASFPQRDDAALLQKYGPQEGVLLLSAVKELEREFFVSNANMRADELPEIGKLAAEDFRKKRPRIAERIVDALTWCYTFANR